MLPLYIISFLISKKMNEKHVIAALLGVAVGDAVGVPIEFINRRFLKATPVTEMRFGGAHNQVIGTWSDDSSMTFCLAEALCKGYDLQEIADNFIKWYDENYWTPHGKVFDIGVTTRKTIENLMDGVSPTQSGDGNDRSNGNGSLMRILPIVFYVMNKPIEERFRIVEEVSSITHSHIRAVICCFIYIEYAILLIQGKEKFAAYNEIQKSVSEFIRTLEITDKELKFFDRVLLSDISQYQKDEIYSSGYVVHTLEAGLWSFLRAEDYKNAVLEAVNLGDDADTTAAVAGGIAGIYYGTENMPAEWLEKLVKRNEIIDLAKRLYAALTECTKNLLCL